MKYRLIGVLMIAIVCRLTSGGYCAPTEATKKIDSRKLAQVVDETRAKFGKAMASWTMVFKAAGVEFHVDVHHAPAYQRYAISVVQGQRTEMIFDVTSREGAWYVQEGDKSAKYRPFEAPVDLPFSYLLLSFSAPVFADPAAIESEAVVDSIDQGVATCRLPTTDSAKRLLQSALKQINSLAGRETNLTPVENEQLQRSRRQIEDLLKDGVQLKVDLKTGLIVESGVPGKLHSLRDFQWYDKIDLQIFNVAGRQWEDKTSSLRTDDPLDIIAIGHYGAWHPGEKAGDTEGELLNIKTGEYKRIPYRGAACKPICFSKNRKRVYVGGVIRDSPAIGLFEIDLQSLAQRQLGGPLLDRGMILFGALSPDGKTLAVTQGLTQPNLMEQQVVLVELSSGESRRLGKPLDCAFLSWLPQGNGIVLVSRKNKSLFEPPEGTVSRLTLDGELVPLLKGDNPSALSPKALILYQMPTGTRQWMTCDLDGKGSKAVLGGLPKFGFPTASPDGSRLVMMKFGGDEGPRPNLINLTSGEIKEIPVPGGLWAWPIWR